MDIKDLYTDRETKGTNAAGFYRLCVKADKREDFEEPLEDTITKAMGKICAIDSRRWIQTILSEFMPGTVSDATEEERRLMLEMFQYTVWPTNSTKDPHDYSDLKVTWPLSGKIPSCARKFAIFCNTTSTTSTSSMRMSILASPVRSTSIATTPGPDSRRTRPSRKSEIHASGRPLPERQKPRLFHQYAEQSRQRLFPDDHVCRLLHQ